LMVAASIFLPLIAGDARHPVWSGITWRIGPLIHFL
jgi:hypothetical protein